MEFSQFFGFLKIFVESIKLVLKNVKLTSSVTALSLLLSSILFLLFSFSYQSAMTYMTNFINTSTSTSGLQIITIFALIFAVEFAFLFAYIAIAHVSEVATVIATATSYTGSKSSLHDLFSAVRARWRSPFVNNFRRSRNPLKFMWVFSVVVPVLVVVFTPNPVTITIASIVGVSVFVFQTYDSVVLALAAVIPVVEDGCEAAGAVERAEKLFEGQMLDGIMVYLFFHILSLIVFLSFWMNLGDEGGLSLAVYGLFFVNCVSLTRISLSVVNTVYYFRCKEYHGEQIQPLGNFHYTTLINNIP